MIKRLLTSSLSILLIKIILDLKWILGLMKKHGVADLPVSIDFAGAYLTNALIDAGIKVVDGNSFMLEAEMIKTDDEVELMKMAACCNEAGFF